jgi:hypothetical protein
VLCDTISPMTLAVPDPGDLAVINTMTTAASAIQLIEALSGGGYSEWDHVVICTRVDEQVWIAEAEPGGAVERPWHYDGVPYRWSTGIIPTNQACAEAAVRYTRPGPWGPRGVPYSFLDYAAIAAHQWHVPAPGLRAYVASTLHEMCSALADQCKLEGGVHLFDDGRWPGFVRPSDIGRLLPAAA